ncbi:metal ABC transporter permease [Micrococcoides hystricis]|uniref:Metal ABC transporter permease n=1 Tax=Micrococcoides hystricis TaxID=1572761 RepID=A0ABV6PBQ3_9MICC
MSIFLAALLLTLATAIVTAIPGVFVVLRRSAMLVDGIGHAILPGIVAGFIITHNLESPLLIAGAALSGLVVVLGAELIQRTGLVSGDAPQGLIFPALFAAGVLAITVGFGDIHLDIDMVMLGDVNLAASGQWIIHTGAGAYSLGPTYLYLMLVMGLINVAFIVLNYRQLKVTTFDPAFARATGIPAGTVNALFMFLVSLTVTAAFEAIGAVLVISLVVAPAATAQLFAQRLVTMFALTAVVAVAVGAGGFLLAYQLDAPTSAMMAVSYGVVFLAALGLSRWQERTRSATAGSALRRSQTGRALSVD